MATLAQLDVRVRGDTSELHRDLEGAFSRARSFADGMTSVGKKLTIGLTAPIVAVGVAAIKMASDAAESASKFQIVFGDAASAMDAWITRTMETVPATRRELQEATANIQQLQVALGATPQAAFSMSQALVQAAADMASFNNVPMTDALDAIRSGLVGESEPLKRFGVLVGEAELKAKALEMGLIKKGEALSKAGRATVIYHQILEQAAPAMGDAARTAEQAANQFRFLGRDAKELATALGEQLLPKVTAMVAQLVNFTGRARETSPGALQFAAAIAAVLAVAGPVLIILGSLAKALIALVNPVGAIVTALAAWIGTVGLIVLTWERLTKGLLESREVIESMPGPMGTVGRALLFIVDAANSATDRIRWLKEETDQGTAAAQSHLAVIRGVPSAMEESAAGTIDFAAAMDKGAGKADKMAGAIRSLIENLREKHRQLTLSDRELLDYELRTNRATAAQRELALKLHDTVAALDAKRERLENAGRLQLQMREAVVSTIAELEKETRALEGSATMVDRYGRAIEFATAKEREQIEMLELRISVLEQSKEAMEKVEASIRKEHEETTKKIEEQNQRARESFIGLADYLTGGWASRVKEALEGMGDLLGALGEKIGGKLGEALGLFGEFGDTLVRWTQTGERIWKGMQAIADLFAIDLIDSITKVVALIAKILGGIWNFFAQILGESRGGLIGDPFGGGSTPFGGGGGGIRFGSAVPTFVVPVYIDGREVARATAPHLVEDIRRKTGAHV